MKIPYEIKPPLIHFYLQPDEPYVSYIGSNGDYNPFVYQAGISSMDIRFMGGPVSEEFVSESMRNLSMVFPTRFTSKKGQNRHKKIAKVLFWTFFYEMFWQ